MGVKTFKCGDIIFRQGDPGDCMYDIQSGQVDIYVDFGGKKKKKIAQLFTQSSHKQLSLKHLLDKDFKSYLPLIMQQLTFSPAYDSLWIQ